LISAEQVRRPNNTIRLLLYRRSYTYTHHGTKQTINQSG